MTQRHREEERQFRVGGQDAGKPVHRTLRMSSDGASDVGPGPFLGTEARDCAKMAAPACLDDVGRALAPVVDHRLGVASGLPPSAFEILRDRPLRTDAVAHIVERQRRDGDAEFSG